MTTLPDPGKPQPHATTAGQPTADDIANALKRSVDDAMQEAARTIAREQTPGIPTFYKNTAPVPEIGTAPPVAQPGRAPMSQRAVDLNTTILSSSVLAAVLGGSGTAVMWASGHANPTVIAWICGCVVAVPAAIAIPVLAFKGLMKSAKEVVQAAPPVIHQHYTGTVNHEHKEITSHNKGLIAINRNDQTDPRA
ncbi:hypothetical protein [Streptomyces sp. NPDC059916]|uniref:hypothetical protein n=1 Tax=Streptomyces sp. NPDC059916 TaxID=3347001 RepID=UPI003673FB7D